ncbi:glycosyltransferase, group 4 family [Leptospira inadai serovar Lyme str. 10]|uniref:Glycosyltransferase, group 4 family n=2 Tax=Leptospira inadai serovar Lyme TaxID=293084 RepID=V6HC55_9LEPT|nr:glycosyltransferase group 4 family [Leptospira inadai]EQA36348.1 glycosyltransferase, group 4 family [Leptospira inadai serovar Lyme str. 10]PNV76388.1 UDP-phosphate N-acetylglucosaminyl 1-phosphate transferase [Leptospira inadai serovar Lyme]
MLVSAELLTSYSATFLLSLGLCRLYIGSKRITISDVPNERSMHQAATKKSGGIWIFVSFSFILGLFSYFGIAEFPLHWWTGILFFFLIGLGDDVKGLSPYLRFGAEFIFLAAWVSLAPFRISLFGYDLGVSPGGFGEVTLISLYLLFFINLCNFMDGLDTYLTTNLIFMAFATTIVSGNDLPFSYLLIFAALFGFLTWNLPKAKLFLGDSGSLFLGFALSALPFDVARSKAFEFSDLFFFAPVFFTDGLLTILVRLYKKENIFRAHRSHLYQLFAIRTHNKGWVSLGFTLANIPGLLIWALVPKYWSVFLTVFLYSFCYVYFRRELLRKKTI